MNPAVPAVAASGDGASALASLGSLLLSLGVVLALILTIAWVLRHLQGRHATDRALRVVATLSLGPRERVVVVDAGGRQVMLGVTAQQITHLATLEQPLRAEHAPAGLFEALLAAGAGRPGSP